MSEKMTPDELKAFYAETRKLVPKSARNPDLNRLIPARRIEARPQAPKPGPPAPKPAPQPKRRKRHLLGWLTLGIVGGIIGGAADGLVQLGELDAKDPQ